MNHTKATKILTMLFTIIFCFGPIGLAEPLGTAFTYQGRLIDANKAADGQDFPSVFSPCKLSHLI